MRYPGGKGKTYQHVINLMPPHEVYIETHLGGGAVLRNKRPSTSSIAIDRDARVIEAWRQRALPGVELHCKRAEDFLEAYQFTNQELVYADPPYHPATRRRERVYAHDYSHDDHVRLLGVLRRLPCSVILSGYAHPLYDDLLAGWQKRTFHANTHAGIREETLWFNFEPPSLLHDCRFLGADFRQRQTVKRRLQRLQDKVRSMDGVERSAFIEWLGREYGMPPGQL